MMGLMVRQTDRCLAVAQTPSSAYYVGTANSISYFLFRASIDEISWLRPKAEVLCSLILGTGKSVVKALEVLSQHKVDGRKVIVLTLFVTPESKFINCQRLFNICKHAIVIRN